MEAPCPRFTAAEGGTRLAATARARNTIVAEHTAFVATRLLHEEAFRIRGPLDANFQRSVYVTRPSRVACVAYHLAILTDLSVLGEAGQDPVTLGRDALDEKQVLVCTSKVIRQVLEEGVLAMENINVLIIDSCHLICKDQDLKYLMSIYKTAEETKRPRILALTYPLFTSTKKETAHDFSLDTTDNVDTTDNADITDNHDVTERSDTCVTVNVDTTGKVDATDNVDTTENNDTTEKGDTCTNVSEDDEGIEDDNTDTVDKTVTLDNVNYSNETKNVDNTADNSNQNPEDKQTEAKSPDSSANTAKLRSKIGVYENYDDFKMYEKLEWKLDELEKELCCSVDLAEDIDSVKRVSATITKPKELIIEFSPQPDVSALPESYVELETFMRAAVLGAIDFLNDHRYDPTEIYGEEMYEEFKNIPNPIIEPRQMFNQFLYVLDQLGPYGADKAAFCLLTKLEKLKIKVPYERHFLLLCLCTSVLLKIRCVAESAFASHETDWNRIQAFSTPKVLRFIEILAKFQPPSSPAESPSKTTNARNTSEDTKSLASIKLLTAIENLDFLTLGNKIEDTVNALDANLRELDGDVNELQGKTDGVVKDGKALQDKTDGLVKGGKEVQDKTDDVVEDGKALQEKTDNVVEEVENEMEKVEGIKGETGVCQQSNGVNFKGFSRRLGHRARGRGRPPRSIACRPQHPLHPDALCGIVFIREPLMAKILFMLIVELSRHHPQLNFLCAQYSAIERPADPVTEPREFEQQRKNQEEVLKKFRMHECNLLLATSAMEEGIDLPRCNLVLRWDIPASYRSYGLCRGRARAPRSACVLLAQAAGDTTERVLQNLATYKELDQIVSRKCGCGVQDEPPQSEEDHADAFTPLVAPYTPLKTSARSTEPASKRIQTVNADTLNCNKCDTERQNANGNCPCTEMFASDSDGKTVNGDSDGQVIASESAEIVSEGSVTIDPGGGITNKTDTGDSPSKVVKSDILGKISYQVFANGKTSDGGVKGDMGGDEIIASVDLSTAIALINRYCGKLPSDTFTRLAPQWRTEAVTLPTRGGAERTAYICTLRMPLNCPVKFNIVGHPMPTRVLARRMVALQACRILHKSGELDNQLMPIGKDNFKAAEVEVTGGNTLTEVKGDPNDLARPGTTKRRQYYFKRTARAFTDCQPVVDTSDSEIDPPGSERPRTWGEDTTEAEKKTISSQNVLYAIVYTLQCALPERYNTRGRRLHAPQNASQALAILTKKTTHPFQIPAFPVYTRSGEVRVSLAPAPAADARVSPRRARLIKAFMRFVFGEVLRVRRRGMRLLSEPGRANNYYIVPTIKTVRPNGTTKIDIDWAFLEVIYKHTEEKRLSELEKPLFWNQDDEETDDATQRDEIAKGNEEKTVQSTGDSEIVTKVETEGLKTEEKKKKEVLKLEKSEGATETSCDVASDVKDQNQGDAAKTDTKQVTTKSVAENAINGADHTKNGAENTINGAENTKNGAEDTKNGVENTKNGAEKTKVKKLDNPLLAPGETFHFDADKYKEAVVTPWYRNQDQPQYFLVAEICWRLSPDSAFPSATHATFRSYYESKYGVSLSQRDQPLLDVDHTSARLNLLTPRYVNRKGVALPVSSERTRRAKRDRLDQKQILVPELCRVHPFAAPLWFATVALPCVLYRINALLIADEIRQAVAEDVGLGIPRIDESTCPGFQWPPLDFGWSLAEVLNADTEKTDKKKPETDSSPHEESENGSRGKEDNGSPDDVPTENDGQDDAAAEKTINDILQEKEDAQNGFEIGTWSNDMAASIPEAVEYDELLDPLPANLTFCTSASGGTNWCDPVRKAQSTFTPSRAFSVADSDCSYMSSDFDTDDSDLNSEGSDEDTDTSGFCSSRNSNAAMGVRIEYKTAHEAEAVDLERKKRTALAPQPDEADDLADKREQDVYMRSGEAPVEYIEKFHDAIENHKQEIHQKRLLILQGQPVENLLPEMSKPPSLDRQDGDRKSRDAMLIEEMFPYGTGETERLFANGEVTLENIEKNKRKLLSLLRDSQPAEALTTLNCFSMKDVDIDAPDYVNEKVTNIGFDSRDSYMERLKAKTAKREFVPYYEDVTVSSSMKEFDFDYQPNLEGHPGPSPSLILQALTMSNANDGINLERLETIGDSFLKFAITAYLYCAHPTVHEGKLSHMRSKQVSNLNLYRLGRNKRLGARMIASKFEPHDNWLPPCHKPPATLDVRPNIDHQDRPEHSSGEGCFIPYNLITQHSIPDKSIADCVEALIGAYLLSCGGRGALLFMSWLGLRVLPRHEAAHPAPEFTKQNAEQPPPRPRDPSDSDSSCSDDEEDPAQELPDEEEAEAPCSWERRAVGSLRPYKDKQGRWWQSVFGELKAPPSPLLRYIADPEGELEVMLSGYDALERTLQYRFRDRSLLLQALTHASHQTNRLTDCYQRLEFLGDAILDYLITRHLYEDSRRHSPGALTDLRSALVNNTIFATLAVRHGFHKYFRHMSPGLNEVLTKYVRIQEENGHSISEEHYLIQEDEMEQAEDVEVPKALGDLFESVAGAIFLDSGMSLGAVWRSYVSLMGAELEAFSAAAPKSPVRELLEAEPDTAKFGKPERLADGRRVRVCVEVFGRGAFKGIGRNYRIAKGTAARCALRHLKKHRAH